MFGLAHFDRSKGEDLEPILRVWEVNWEIELRFGCTWRGFFTRGAAMSDGVIVNNYHLSCLGGLSLRSVMVKTHRT